MSSSGLDSSAGAASAGSAAAAAAAGEQTTWKTWLPRLGRTARIVGMAVLAVPAVVWLRKVVSGRPRPAGATSSSRSEVYKVNGLTKEERERNERMENYASQIVASVVSQALEQYKRELEKVQ